MSKIDINLIVGLGNPGDAYSKTRHNAGFWFLDRLVLGNSSFAFDKNFKASAAKIELFGKKIILCKPNTFMNKSGDSVRSIIQFYKIPPEQILVAHDELDLPAGVSRLKVSGGHGGHNGIRDIIQKIGSKDFMRLRIGIDHPGNSRDVSDYVLSKAKKDEYEKINNSLYYANNALQILYKEGLDKAMQYLHSKR